MIHIARQMEQEVADAVVAMDGYRRARWRGIILYGMAGCGKTAIAAALSNCQQVRTIFHEGVLWVDGSRDTTKEMARLCKAMGVQRKCGETWTECWRRWAREPERHILLILDGVDTPAALRPWVSEIGGQVVVLVTTRQAWRVERVLAQWLGSKTILGFGMCGLSPEEGHHLVERWVQAPTHG